MMRLGQAKESVDMASRVLNDPLEKRILPKSPGGGRSTSYKLCRINT